MQTGGGRARARLAHARRGLRVRSFTPSGAGVGPRAQIFPDATIYNTNCSSQDTFSFVSITSYVSMPLSRLSDPHAYSYSYSSTDDTTDEQTTLQLYVQQLFNTAIQDGSFQTAIQAAADAAGIRRLGLDESSRERDSRRRRLGMGSVSVIFGQTTTHTPTVQPTPAPSTPAPSTPAPSTSTVAPYPQPTTATPTASQMPTGFDWDAYCRNRTDEPSPVPTTGVPSPPPSAIPTTGAPSAAPSYSPSAVPSAIPTPAPTQAPSPLPTISFQPTSATFAPTYSRPPTAAPSSGTPSIMPTSLPTTTPTAMPSPFPTFSPTSAPTGTPTTSPTPLPSPSPTAFTQIMITDQEFVPEVIKPASMDISTTVLNVERLDQNYEIFVEIGATLNAAGLTPVITVLEGGTTNSYKETKDVLLARKYMTVEVSMSTQGVDEAVPAGTYDLELILQIETPVYADDLVTVVNTYYYNVTRPITLQISSASVVANSYFQLWDTPILDGGMHVVGKYYSLDSDGLFASSSVDTSTLKVEIKNPNAKYDLDTTDVRRRLSAVSKKTPVEQKVECTAYDCTDASLPTYGVAGGWPAETLGPECLNGTDGFWAVACTMPSAIASRAGLWTLEAEVTNTVDGTAHVNASTWHALCPSGYYEQDDPFYPDTFGLCTSCVDNGVTLDTNAELTGESSYIDCEGAGHVRSALVMKAGMWRSSTSENEEKLLPEGDHTYNQGYVWGDRPGAGSEVFRECLTPVGCPGKNVSEGQSGNQLCKRGHVGPLCAVCAEGYVIDGVTFECLECNSENKKAGIIVMVGIPVMMLAAVGLIYLILMRLKPCMEADGATTINPDTGKHFTNMELIKLGIARVKAFVAKRRDFIKVILNYMQSASPL